MIPKPGVTPPYPHKSLKRFEPQYNTCALFGPSEWHINCLNCYSLWGEETVLTTANSIGRVLRPISSQLYRLGYIKGQRVFCHRFFAHHSLQFCNLSSWGQLNDPRKFTKFSHVVKLGGYGAKWGVSYCATSLFELLTVCSTRGSES